MDSSAPQNKFRLLRESPIGSSQFVPFSHLSILGPLYCWGGREPVGSYDTWGCPFQQLWAEMSRMYLVVYPHLFILENSEALMLLPVWDCDNLYLPLTMIIQGSPQWIAQIPPIFLLPPICSTENYFNERHDPFFSYKEPGMTRWLSQFPFQKTVIKSLGGTVLPLDVRFFIFIGPTAAGII